MQLEKGVIVWDIFTISLNWTPFLEIHKHWCNISAVQKLVMTLFFHCFSFRYGRVESVKVLPKRGSEGGVAAFVDFVDIKSAQKAHNAINKMGDRDLRTDYNEPGTIPSAARGLDDSLSLGSRGRDVSGFTRAAGGAVYGPPTSLHSRDGRYERRLDG